MRHMIRQMAASVSLLMLFALQSLAQTAATGIALGNQQALEKLQKRAAETHSDAVVIFKDNQLVAEWYFDKDRGKIELMSCTKSVVNIAIGRLIDTGKIKSLDQPVHEFYPEWNQGRKKLITIRHLLNQTSNLQNVPNTTVEIYPSPDFIKLALAAEVEGEPGTTFRYNNKAVNLLAGIIQKASGKRMDHYFRDEIFQPMGITDFNWTLDEAGNPHTMSGLELSAIDFAKFGQLILNKGAWNGTRIVSEKWVEESMKPAAIPGYGLLWWLTPNSVRVVIEGDNFKQLEASGKVSPSFLNKLAPLKDKVFDGRQAFAKALGQALSEKGSLDEVIYREVSSKGLQLVKWTVDEVLSYNANGYLGQYLVIYPRQRLVAVRQVRSSKTYNEQTDGFEDFMDLVRSLDQ